MRFTDKNRKTVKSHLGKSNCHAIEVCRYDKKPTADDWKEQQLASGEVSSNNNSQEGSTDCGRPTLCGGGRRPPPFVNGSGKCSIITLWLCGSVAAFAFLVLWGVKRESSCYNTAVTRTERGAMTALPLLPLFRPNLFRLDQANDLIMCSQMVP